MTQGRHKRQDSPSRVRRVFAPLAASLTVTAVAVGTLSAADSSRSDGSAATTAGPAAEARAEATATARDTTDGSWPAAEQRPQIVSRSASRLERKPNKVDRLLSHDATRAAVRGADTTLWAGADLNLWDAPGKTATQIGLLELGESVLVTGRALFGRQEIVIDDRALWVTAGYLQQDEPDLEAQEAGTCSNGTSVPAGVSTNIKAVHAAVCAAFPEIATYGTLRSDGEHAQGIAVDIMVSGTRGWEVARFVRENAGRLGVSYVIHARNIWSVQRTSEGWRGMEDRGSVTANHYDHVHVTTY
ncbi:hypothetical protein G6553_07095 [Nocardioides sp. IC4_145]|uniref:hypothetical protein n=1 Tax=Nocardioides sp. IC4_145 TaxID=2714037 RepID=UPI00140E76F6|nr:hypothetical protein [Nocardioides sp. IC4_145]NHC22937.1 hypothetical protein [Nocardioides sp. IC4_145]